LAAKEKTLVKTTLKLAAVLAIVSASAFWYQYKHVVNTAGLKYQEKNPLVIPSADSMITEFKIKNSGALIDLKCVSSAGCTFKNIGDWKIASDPVNPNAVKQFLTEATSNYPAEPIDISSEAPEKRKTMLGEFGLSEEQRAAADATSIEVTLASGQGAAIHLNEWFGHEDGIGESTYAASGVEGKMNEQKVFVLNKRLKALVDSMRPVYFAMPAGK
jgi:hypothetical protein